mmetsp:Transcript_42824/g.103396  ORF Transcript_42824/g.103396 Transcript_42824/m.103396 type:complete len:366 (+) Transcript_42824:109-1206(+)
MADYITFTDPVFLARFGLSRSNALDYFLLPLNPFRTPNNTSNETLSMQGTSIMMMMQQGQPAMFHHAPNNMMMMPGTMSLQEAEIEYHKTLQRMTGEQYELLPPVDPAMYDQPLNLFTIRHVLRQSPTSTKILGVYYIVEGVIYKSPTIRSLMKSNVARVVDALANTSSTLSHCARYLPSTGYTWRFEGDGGDDDDDDGDEEEGDTKKKNEHTADVAETEDNQKHQQYPKLSNEENPVFLIKSIKRQKRRKILDNRPIGERSEAEEEGLRATIAMDQILVRLNKSPYVSAVVGSSNAAATTTTTTAAHAGTTGSSSSSLLQSNKKPSSLIVTSGLMKPNAESGERSSGGNDNEEEDVVSIAEPSG